MASGGHRTPKIPLIAQYHGASSLLKDLTSRIPIGKNIPIRIPRGKVKRIEIIALLNIEYIVICNRIVGRIHCRARIDKAVTMGHIKIQEEALREINSLRKLPTPTPEIIVKSRTPKA